MNIDELELTIRASNALRNAGIETVEQLVALDWTQLDDIRSAGEKSLAEICWQCIQLLNGRMTERRIEYDKKWPPREFSWDEYREMRNKAKKYDQIAKIIGA